VDGAVVIDPCSSHLSARAIATPYFSLASIVLLQERKQLKLAVNFSVGQASSRVRPDKRRRVVSSDTVVRDREQRGLGRVRLRRRLYMVRDRFYFGTLYSEHQKLAMALAANHAD
jgi:hypothetical protein